LSNAQDIEVAESFIDWGIPTAKALIDLKQALPHQIIFASGGLKNGKDLAKCLALGANLAGLAGVFLRAAMLSTNHLIESIAIMQRILRISMFATGSKNLEDFQNKKIRLKVIDNGT
jgi:isopentenyl-diphosphate delta-isomerase